MFNRNTKVETFSGNIQINHYDAEEQRHEIEENGKLVSFIFCGDEVVTEESQEDKIRYIRTNVLAASDAESARMYYHYASDEMGSITYVVDSEAKEILNQYDYDTWGNPTVCEEKVSNRFRFNGQQYDLITQQYYLRARYYNPVIGRFTQEDTYRGDGLNLYVYCANNPVYYVDPSGHSACPGETDRIKNLVNKNKVNHGQGFSNKVYNPQPGERTFDGYVKQTSDPEIALYTKSTGFNNQNGEVGGQFKRFGANSHYGLSPHVHQPTRHVDGKGIVHGRTGKTVGVDTLLPDRNDVKQLYQYLNKGKYHK